MVHEPSSLQTIFLVCCASIKHVCASIFQYVFFFNIGTYYIFKCIHIYIYILKLRYLQDCACNKCRCVQIISIPICLYLHICRKHYIYTECIFKLEYKQEFISNMYLYKQAHNYISTESVYFCLDEPLFIRIKMLILTISTNTYAYVKIHSKKKKMSGIRSVLSWMHMQSICIYMSKHNKYFVYIFS